LINPKYFSGVYDGERVEKLWEVWEYIKNTYEEDHIERIYISGDGADWIKFGVKYLPIQKYITMALKDDKKLKRALWKEIFRGDKEKVIGIKIW